MILLLETNGVTHKIILQSTPLKNDAALKRVRKV